MKSTKFVILPPFRDTTLNNLQKLESFSEQIANMPQNRGCLSWDAEHERNERDAWERGERWRPEA